jgi:hypothetical protein
LRSSRPAISVSIAISASVLRKANRAVLSSMLTA